MTLTQGAFIDFKEGALLSLSEPIQRCFTFREIEVLEFCTDEMIGELWDDLG
jgi:hypothetical protein